MTVTANTTRNQYTAGYQQNTYFYTFQIHDASDLQVYIGDELKSLNTHYTVTGVGNGTGGSVVFDLGVDGNGQQIYIAEDTVVSIFLTMDLDRDTNYQPSGAFLASTVNNDFDRLWLASNQQQTDINRSVRLKDLDSQSDMTLPLLADRADKLFGFGASASGAKPTVVTNNSSQWDIAYNNMITGMQFQSGGILRLSQQDGSDYTVDLDGRYHIIGTDIPDADISESSVTQHRTAMLDIPTNVRAKFGNSDELEIYYDGNTSVIKESGNGNLAILGDNVFLGNPDGTKNYFAAQDGLSVGLYYNNQLKFATDANGIDVTGTVQFDGLSGTGSVIVTDILDEDNMASDSATALATQQSIKAYVDANGGGTATGVDLADNVKATFGDGDDLEIYHDGSNSYIHDAGTGGLYIKGSDEIALRSSSNENIFLGLTNGSAYVYHDGSVKLQTTSTGIDVTGTVTADGLTSEIASSGARATLATFRNSASLAAGAQATIQLKNGGQSAFINGESVAANSGMDIVFSSNDSTSTETNKMRLAENGDISFYEDTGTTPKFFWDASAERLGIGTSSPIRALDVRGGTTDIVANFESSDTGGYISLQDNTTSSDTAVLVGAIGDDLRIDTGDTEALRIKADGKVGIGTDDPDTKLHVSGGDLKIVSDNANTGEDGIPSILFGELTGGAPHAQISYHGDDEVTDANYIGLGVFDPAQSSADTLAEQKLQNTLAITRAGNVGIGTTSPDSSIQVKSSGTNNQSLLKLNTDSGTRAFIGSDAQDDGYLYLYDGSDNLKTAFRTDGNDSYIAGGGNVGIGTTSPTNKLHVDGGTTGTDVDVAKFSSNTGAFAIKCSDLSAANPTWTLRTFDGETLAFGDGTTENMRIDASGNVGIGTSSPTTKLDVNGTVTATAFAGDGSALTGLPAGGISNVVEDTTPQLGGDLDAQDNEINNVDKLGINTSSPSVACDVQFVKTGDLVAGLRVHTSAATSFDGKVITWGEQTAERGVLGWADAFGLDSCYIASGTAGLRFQRTFGSSPKIVPCSSTGAINDNAIDLGDSNAEFDDIYANNSSIISSSDSTLKQDIETLTDAEGRVAVACKGLLRKFRWRDAVEEKGDEARIHFGIMAQDLRDAFTAEGLDAGRYGMFISNTWWEHEGEHYPTSDSAPEGATEVTRLGVRYTELLAFIISAI